MLGGFQRSPNEFIPVHKHLRSYRPRLTVWSLPEEILIQLLKSLHVKDLLSMRAVGVKYLAPGFSTCVNWFVTSYVRKSDISIYSLLKGCLM